MSRLLLVFACLTGPALAGEAPAEPDPYFVGLNIGWIRNLSEKTRLQWGFDTGASMPRIGMRMDLFKTLPGHPDAGVRLFCSAGRSAMAFLFNGGGQITLPDGTTKPVDEKVPDNLWEPVFTNGQDTPSPAADLNPKNEWAFFVGRIVERYDADGLGDAPGSPRLTYYSLYNEPDWMKWPDRPKDPKMTTLRNWEGHDFSDLARLAFISWQAGKFADPTCKIGVQLCFASSLGFLLDDPRHPLARNVDFVDFHAYAWPGSDTLVTQGDGMQRVLASMRAEFVRRHLPQPKYICSEVGYQGDDSSPQYSQAVQRAAAAKVQVVAASIPDLLCAHWYGLFDPSYRSMGLIADVSGLPADGKGWQPRDAYYATITVARLLDGMAKGTMRSVGELDLGEAAKACRFERDGQPLFVAWATDLKGEPGRTARVALPLPAGRYARYHWDFALTGRPSALFEATGAPVELEVGIDPVYLLRIEGEPLTAPPMTRPQPPPPPPWTISADVQDPTWPARCGFDGNFDTHWTGGWGRESTWWQVDFDEPVTASSVRVKFGKLEPGLTCVVQVSPDGRTWTAVSPALSSDDYGTQTARLDAPATSRHWRLHFALPTRTCKAKLFEIEIGDVKGR